jgi:DNA-binding LacI/PurR family transcriptional regulator
MVAESRKQDKPGDPYIFQVLRERIIRGEYGPGTWLPTERELAEAFRVDRYAVRNALVRLATEGLIVREPGRRPWVRPHNPSPQEWPRTPAVGAEPRPHTVMAILWHHATNYNALDILRGINATLRDCEAPCRLLVFDTCGDDRPASVALERRALQAVEREGVSGAIIAPIGRGDTVPDLRRLQEKGIPVVFVDRYPHELTCDFVGIDNRASAQSIIRYLLDLGHRRIAHLTSRDAITTVQHREQGYREALHAAGITPRPEWVYRGETPADMHAALDQFFALDEPPTAVFALNDDWAHLLIAAAETRGLHVPDDLSVVGFDNYERYSPRPPLLTTQHQPFDEVGRRAAELIVERLSAPDGSTRPCQHILLPTHLVKRSTCRPLSAGDDHTEKGVIEGAEDPSEPGLPAGKITRKSL